MRDSMSADRLIALMALVCARRALFFDVTDLAISFDLTVTATYTAATERRESE
jgi:hypothetical protein